MGYILTQFRFLIWQEIVVWDDYFAEDLNDSTPGTLKWALIQKKDQRLALEHLALRPTTIYGAHPIIGAGIEKWWHLTPLLGKCPNPTVILPSVEMLRSEIGLHLFEFLPCHLLAVYVKPWGSYITSFRLNFLLRKCE